jgi:chitin disaccharide deacetylase
MELLLKPAWFFYFLTGLFLMSTNLFAQQGLPTLAGQLGHPPDAKLLIIHADDLGVAHSKNSASTSAWEKGGINSASIMVPTPWFSEIANYARKNPEFDLGLHLTLTAEWDFYKWNGVLPSTEIPSLVNDQDYFYASVAEVVQNGDPAEVEKEIRAQIERAIDFGIQPTHLDSHMGTLFAHPNFFDAYLKAGQEYQIPVLVPRNWIENAMFSDDEDSREILKRAREYPVLVQRVIMLTPDTPESDWFDAYDQAIKNLEPGLNEMLIHPAYADAEMKAMTINHHHSFDAEWRQRDFDYVVSRGSGSCLKKKISNL